MKPLVIAHRGASTEAPENSRAAFDRAVDAGAGAVECDVHAAADGVLVVLHDATLERTTTGRGAVADSPSPALTRLHLRDAAGRIWDEGVPLLAEVLDGLRGRLPLLIERKSGVADAFSRALAGLPPEAATLQSFDWEFLTAVNLLAPERPLAALGEGRLLTTHLRGARHTGATTLAWRHGDLDAPAVAAAHAAGLAVYAWTVDEPARSRQLAAFGVDGIITNTPRALRGVL